MKKLSGYTLIETLVVVIIFAVIGIIASETLILTLRGTSKAGSISKVRQTLDFAMGSMERQLRGAQSIDSSTCTGTPSKNIIFTDQNKNKVEFKCQNVNPNNLPSDIASNSGYLTNSTINISTCDFTCYPAVGKSPAYVTISITANDLSGENSVTDTTQVTLRSY